MVHTDRMTVLGLVVVLMTGAFGCGLPANEPLASETADPDRPAPTAPDDAMGLPVLQTYADTVAMRVFEASGGPAAWNALPYLRFNYAVRRERERGHVIRHFWDRRNGMYRVELPGPGQEPYISVFNVDTGEGRAYWQGAELEATEASRQLEEAYRRFVNDTYWLLVPFKLFDPGVHRTYVPDSSDATYDVIRLHFDGVGLTPGDRYWLFVDRETGRLARWTYVLQGDAPDAPPRSFVWEDYEEHATAAGPLYFATRKRGVGAPFAILTDGIETPTRVPDDMFTASQARLTPSSPN